MLILHPREVSFAALTFTNVTSIVIDRTADRVLVEHGDGGPFPVFADAPEQRITVRLVMDIAGDAIGAPGLGETGTLEFTTAPAGPRITRHKVSMEAVITAVTHEVSLRKGAERKIELVAISTDGDTDPVSIMEVT